MRFVNLKIRERRPPLLNGSLSIPGRFTTSCSFLRPMCCVSFTIKVLVLQPRGFYRPAFYFSPKLVEYVRQSPLAATEE
jgi:hypothetical protein